MSRIILSFVFLYAGLVNANTETYYFAEKDGPNHTIFYKAFCAKYPKISECSLKSISVRNAQSNLKCTIAVEELYSWGEAKKVGDIWIISSSVGGCGYTNTYQISNTGMVQVKSSPKNKKFNGCEVFEPKTYKMKYHRDVSDIELSVEGCKNLSILSLN